MRCCVPNCKNDTKNISKTQGITFHVFPVDSELRSAWQQSLGKGDWEPKERAAVCSDHFLAGDLYYTKSGLRRVRPGALPVVQNQTNTINNGSMKVCRICFALHVKLFPISTGDLQNAYEGLTGFNVNEDNGDVLPKYLCTLCARYLINSYKFKEKTLQSHSLLTDLVNNGKLTIQTMRALNKDHEKLTQKHYAPDHCDLSLNEDDNIVGSVEPLQVVNVDIDVIQVKNEDTQFIEEIDKEYEDVPHEELAIDSNVDSNIADRDYSTDDSLPLETRRKKEEKPKKIEKKVKKTAKKPPAEPKIDRRRKPFLNTDLNETLFTVTNLTFEEQVAEIEKRQETANYKNAVFKCTECYKGFLDEDAYNSHISRHTNECGEYKCSICKIHFKNPHALRKHITAHHTQRFSCNTCVYVTTHRQTARLHERWHKGTRYQCPHCSDDFVKFTTYMGHIRIKHPSDFVCELCGYSFVSKKGIELHKKLKHRVDAAQTITEGPYCEVCAVRFGSDEAYKRHILVSPRHNTDDKDNPERNKCKSGKPRPLNDGKPRKERRADQKRMYPSQLRKAEGPIPCEQCGLQLEDSRAYHGHFRRMHPDKNRTNYPSMKSPCMCEVCGRIFQSYSLLKDHTWVHTGERPFKCSECGKSFRMKQRLVAHRRVHSQARTTYDCQLCGKQFSTHSNRQRHMFIHTGLKPFKCEMCGKGFKHASEKRAHVSYVHLKKPWPKRSRGKRRETRQGSLPPPPLPQPNDMELAAPPWCEQKLTDVNSMDKPLYYHMKL